MKKLLLDDGAENTPPVIFQNASYSPFGTAVRVLLLHPKKTELPFPTVDSFALSRLRSSARAL